MIINEVEGLCCRIGLVCIYVVHQLNVLYNSTSNQNKRYNGVSSK